MPSTSDGMDFFSRDEITVALRPLLTVDYTPPEITLYYGDDTAGMPKIRSFDDGAGTWSVESDPAAAAGTIRWTVAEGAPWSSEEIVVVLDDTGRLDAKRWDGAAWSNDWNSSTILNTDSDKRGFDPAYYQAIG